MEQPILEKRRVECGGVQLPIIAQLRGLDQGFGYNRFFGIERRPEVHIPNKPDPDEGSDGGGYFEVIGHAR